MNKNTRRRALPQALFLLLLCMIVLLTAACASLAGTSGKPAAPPAEEPGPAWLYDYEAVYAWRNLAYEPEKSRALAELLQSRDILTVKETNYSEDRRVLQINFQLNLTEENPNYTVNFTRQMQDAVVLFALFEYLQGVEFNFVQADYGFGGIPIMRADAETVFGEPIVPFGSTKADFTKKFPAKVQAVVWEKAVMDTVNYYHAMGLDR